MDCLGGLIGKVVGQRKFGQAARAVDCLSQSSPSLDLADCGSKRSVVGWDVRATIRKSVPDLCGFSAQRDGADPTSCLRMYGSADADACGVCLLLSPRTCDVEDRCGRDPQIL